MSVQLSTLGDVIKTAYEGESNTNAFTDADHTKLDGIETGATKYPDTGEQAFLDADHTKLDGIETGATKYPDTGEQAFLDADHTKLDGIATGADVTADNPPQSHGHSSHTDRATDSWLGSPHHTTGGTENYGIALDPDTDEVVTYSWKVPTNFVSILGADVWYKADVGSNNIVLDIGAAYGTENESQAAHYDADTGNIIAISDTSRHKFTTAGLLGNIAAGDILMIWVTRDANHASDANTGDLVIAGINIRYTADT